MVWFTKNNPPPEMLRPHNDRILVHLDSEFDYGEGVRQSEGGILIPENTTVRRPSTGHCVSKGPKVEGIEVGDKVLCLRHCGTNVPMPHERQEEEGDWVVLYEHEILGVWTKEDLEALARARKEAEKAAQEEAPEAQLADCEAGSEGP